MIAESELWGTAVGFLALVGIFALLHIWDQSKTDQKTNEARTRATTENQKACVQSTQKLETALSSMGTSTSDQKEAIERELSRRARTRTTRDLVAIVGQEGHLGRDIAALYMKVLRERLSDAIEHDLEISRIDIIDDEIDDKTLELIHNDAREESGHWQWLVTHGLLLDRGLGPCLPTQARAEFIAGFVDERLDALLGE